MYARSAVMFMILQNMMALHSRTCPMTGNVRDASRARISSIQRKVDADKFGVSVPQNCMDTVKEQRL